MSHCIATPQAFPNVTSHHHLQPTAPRARWSEAYFQQKREKQLLAQAGLRLAKPQLVRCFNHWNGDWQEALWQASVDAERRKLNSAKEEVSDASPNAAWGWFLPHATLSRGPHFPFRLLVPQLAPLASLCSYLLSPSPSYTRPHTLAISNSAQPCTRLNRRARSARQLHAKFLDSRRELSEAKNTTSEELRAVKAAAEEEMRAMRAAFEEQSAKREAELLAKLHQQEEESRQKVTQLANSDNN